MSLRSDVATTVISWYCINCRASASQCPDLFSSRWIVVTQHWPASHRIFYHGSTQSLTPLLGSSVHLQDSSTSLLSSASSTGGGEASEWITFSYTVFVYKCLRGFAPSYLNDKLCRVADIEARYRLHSTLSSLVFSPLDWLPLVTEPFWLPLLARIWNSLLNRVSFAASSAQATSATFSPFPSTALDCTVPMHLHCHFSVLTYCKLFYSISVTTPVMEIGLFTTLC